MKRLGCSYDYYHCCYLTLARGRHLVLKPELANKSRLVRVLNFFCHQKTFQLPIGLSETGLPIGSCEMRLPYESWLLIGLYKTGLPIGSHETGLPIG